MKSVCTQGVQATMTVTILTTSTVVRKPVQLSDIAMAFAKAAALVKIVIIPVIVVAQMNAAVCCQSGTCETCNISLASWIVAAIVISVLLVVAVPVGIVVCCCCCVASASSRPVHRGVVVTGQQNPATSVIAVQNSQMQSSAPAYIQNPPYGNQLQGYPPPGPPQQQKQGYPPPPAYNAHY